MHKELQDVFDLHEKETPTQTRKAKDQSAEILKVLADVESYLLRVEQRIHIAEATADDELGLENNFNHLHRQVEMVRDSAQEIRKSFRRFTMLLTGLKSQMDVGKVNINNVISLRTNSTDVVTERVKE